MGRKLGLLALGGALLLAAGCGSQTSTVADADQCGKEVSSARQATSAARDSFATGDFGGGMYQLDQAKESLGWAEEHCGRGEG